jgi:hypothetical protein
MRAISSFVTTLRSPPSSTRMPIPGPVRGKRRFDSNVVAQGFWFQVRGKLNGGAGYGIGDDEERWVWSGLDNTKQENDDMQKSPKHGCNDSKQSRNMELSRSIRYPNN